MKYRLAGLFTFQENWPPKELLYEKWTVNHERDKYASFEVSSRTTVLICLH